MKLYRIEVDVAMVGPVERYLCLSVDIEKYGTRNDVGQRALQEELARTLDDASVRAGLDRRRWISQAKGDEELALIPPTEPHAAVVGTFCQALAAVLYARNRDRLGSDRVRLRLAIDEGPVSMAALGFAGRAVVGVSRLVNSWPVRRALSEAVDAHLAVIVSDGVYRDWIRAGHASVRAEFFRQVHVAEKELHEYAWLWIPGTDVHGLALSEGAVSTASAEPVKYVVNINGGRGIQIGDHNTQTNMFTS